MSRATTWLTRVAACVAIGGIATAVGSCVSDRSATSVVDPSACNIQLPSEAFGTTIVIIRNFAFTPQQVSVRAGTKVTWVNCSAAGDPSHTSTSDTGIWSSPLLAPGATFTQEFATPGSFPFHCEPHPSMTGTVTVN
jgi:plastocyanin